MRDPFTVLGVDPSASLDDVRAAYDIQRRQTGSCASEAEAAQRLREIDDAYAAIRRRRRMAKPSRDPRAAPREGSSVLGHALGRVAAPEDVREGWSPVASLKREIRISSQPVAGYQVHVDPNADADAGDDDLLEAGSMGLDAAPSAFAMTYALHQKRRAASRSVEFDLPDDLMTAGGMDAPFGPLIAAPDAKAVFDAATSESARAVYSPQDLNGERSAKPPRRRRRRIY